MNNKSRKAKGRYLQNIVRDKIIELYPTLSGFIFSIAQNDEIKSDNSFLEEGKIDIFPPFSGG